MKTRFLSTLVLTVFGLIVVLSSALVATEPLTDAEKMRLAEVDKEARRLPEMRKAAEQFAAARKAYTDDRRKFAVDRNPDSSKIFKAATASFEAQLRMSMLQVDPSIEPLLNRQSELKKLGMLKANEGENTTDSDAKKNAAMQPVKDVPGLPRVLLIGDSISIGYTLAVREKLAGKANLHRIPQNGGATEVGLEKIDSWLGTGKWDVIHFNFGLHDAKYMSETTQRASREQYVQNLSQLIERMKATGARLVFATTTPVPMQGVLSPTRKFDSIQERNRLAIELMKKQGVAIDDLYQAVLPHQEKVGRPNDVHYSPAGYELLAEAVATSISSQLPSK